MDATDVFISYSTEDKHIADAVCHVLEEQSITCWIAPRDVLPGITYAKQIIHAIKECKVLILIFSKKSNVSEHVGNEIDRAFNANKPIIPFVIEETSINEELDYYLSRKHWLVAYPDYKEKTAALVTSVLRLLGRDKPIVKKTDPQEIQIEGDHYLVNIDGMKFNMIRVEGGKAIIGATPEQGKEAKDDEKPVHTTEIQTFYMGQFPVTQNIWKKVMGYNKSHFIYKENEVKGKVAETLLQQLSEVASSSSVLSTVNSLIGKPLFHNIGSVTKASYYMDKTKEWASSQVNHFISSECDDFGHYPVESITHDEAVEFTRRLSKLTNIPFSLPSEEEWEYAARGGNKSKGYRFAGSNDLDDVAWYNNNSGDSTHPVGEKMPNELGLYDMCGNVWEWTETPAHSYSFQDIEPAGNCFIRRGGSWWHEANNCRVSRRYPSDHSKKTRGLGLRIIVRLRQKEIGIQSAPNKKSNRSATFKTFENTAQNFSISGVDFAMIKVCKGEFIMGALSPHKTQEVIADLSKPHPVIISKDFYIGETPVTQKLWKVVMNNNPSRFKDDARPVDSVSWNDCQSFVERLSCILGLRFRMPTEAEWEYAARGGSENLAYQFSGSNNIDDVAWFSGNSDDQTHPVRLKKPNELGIYDMSGNVWEWCSDFYDEYDVSILQDPIGPPNGIHHVYRGGCWSENEDCRVTVRRAGVPEFTSHGGLGLRLALSI